MTNNLYLDFETYSEVDIKKHGGKQYAEDESTQVLCLGYAFNNEPADVWVPSTELPDRIAEHVHEGGLVYAHNAVFDWRIWNSVLARDFVAPTLHLKQCVDTMALCQTFTVPASLAMAGAALNLKLPKLESGVRLINMCCKPDKQGNQPLPWENKAVFQELFLYCKRDVEAMREIVQSLPREQLILIEQRVWRLTARMNDTGLPIDVDAVSAILTYLSQYVKNKMSAVEKITNGQVRTINQIAKVQAWCEDQGYEMPNLQAETIVKALADPEIPEGVRALLLLRQELGRTSTAKFKKVNDLVYLGYVHDNLQYHGTGTGRWAGRGFQMQNLPRDTVKDPEEEIRKFIEGERVEDPVSVGKALVRPIILAPPGFTIMVSDYSSIENRVLAWLAGDKITLQGFRDGFDQYKDMAASLYQIPLEEVTKDQRQFGKVVILGAGYMMGADRFREVAASWGIMLAEHEAKHAIEVYREKYSLIKRLWFRLNSTAKEAVLTGTYQEYLRIKFGTATVKGIRWLAMQLPSGKSVYYMDPRVEPKYIPGYERMGKVPTITHLGMNPYSRKWDRLALSPGRTTENATQATAREVMAYGMLNVQDRMPDCTLVGTVHDEALTLIPEKLETQEYMDEFNNNLCDIPWAPSCPMKAEGYFSKRYKKG